MSVIGYYRTFRHNGTRNMHVDRTKHKTQCAINETTNVIQ